MPQRCSLLRRVLVTGVRYLLVIILKSLGCKTVGVVSSTMYLFSIQKRQIRWVYQGTNMLFFFLLERALGQQLSQPPGSSGGMGRTRSLGAQGPPASQALVTFRVLPLNAPQPLIAHRFFITGQREKFRIYRSNSNFTKSRKCWNRTHFWLHL